MASLLCQTVRLVWQISLPPDQGLATERERGDGDCGPSLSRRGVGRDSAYLNANRRRKVQFKPGDMFPIYHDAIKRRSWRGRADYDDCVVQVFVPVHHQQPTA